MRQRPDGSLAQLGEHLPYKQRVTGSSPVTSTNMELSKPCGLESFCLVEGHLIPYFGAARLSDIRPADIQAYFATKTECSDSRLKK